MPICCVAVNFATLYLLQVVAKHISAAAGTSVDCIGLKPESLTLTSTNINEQTSQDSHYAAILTPLDLIVGSDVTLLVSTIHSIYIFVLCMRMMHPSHSISTYGR